MPTIIDVAKKAGVAISTVSNIVNKKGNVSKQTTQKVNRVIEELEYEVNPVARNMKSTHSNMIGIVITNFSRIFFAPVLRYCREIAEAQGYNLLCIESNDDFKLEQQYINMMKNNHFDAIILDTVAGLDDKEYFESLQRLTSRGKRIAVVCIERDLTGYGLDSVDVSNFAGSQKAMEHLTACGCKRILHITGPVNSWAAEWRARGYSDHINRQSDAEHLIAIGDFSPKSGYDAVRKLLMNNLTPPFDAIFASNDQMAVGAIKALQKHGISIPEQVKVMGFDDSFVASLIDPALTSVHVSRSQIGMQAMRMVLERINDPDIPPSKYTVETQLVVRESTDPNVYIAPDFDNW